MQDPKQHNKPADEIIRQKIQDILVKDPSIDSTKIIIEVNNRTVNLKGGIDTDAEKQRCEELAKTVEGVKSVENHLHIDLGLAHALSSLAAHIQGDIIRDDEPEEDDNTKEKK